MLQRLMFVLPLGTLFAFAAVPRLAFGDVVTNGTFEDVVGTSPGSPGPLTGWTVGDPPNMFASSVIPHSGSWVAALGSVDAGVGVLSQNLSTVTGQRYQLSYWLSSSGLGPNSFSAWWNSTVFTGSELTDEITIAGENYEQFVFSFIATGTTTTLEFRATDEFGFWHLDDVEVRAVPDGGITLMLLGGALAGLEPLRRRLRA